MGRNGEGRAWGRNAHNIAVDTNILLVLLPKTTMIENVSNRQFTRGHLANQRMSVLQEKLYISKSKICECIEVLRPAFFTDQL